MLFSVKERVFIVSKTMQDEEKSPYPQPLSGGNSRKLSNNQEIVGYLPGTSCRIWYTHLPTAFLDHRHNALEIVDGENGYYKCEVEGTMFEVHRGDILIIPPDVTHALCPQDGCNGFVHLFDVGVLRKIKCAASFLSEMTKPIFITEKSNPRLYATVSAHLAQMRKAYFSDNHLREMLVYAHLLAFLDEAWKNRTESTQNTLHIRAEKRKEYADIFNEVLYYISQHYTQELSIDILAKRFGFSRYHFARLFKQYTSLTLCDYLNFQRIKAAERLLFQFELTLTDIAYQSGFSSSSVFSRVFKQYKKCTPSEYRKLYVK